MLCGRLGGFVNTRTMIRRVGETLTEQGIQKLDG